ncbi:MAG: PilZ domain-containing protein [Candidatus Eremiobacteraeota bacterium]|nr:PilZ domain-containing protein [Candidatus Eremiobacteraeota bacterium]
MHNKRRTYRQNVEMPVELKVTGYPVEVRATMTDLSAEGCRIRSLIALEKGAALNFSIRGAGGKSLELRGRIAARKKIVGQAYYAYGVTFETISSGESAKVIAVVMEIQRRAAADRSAVKSGSITGAKPGKKRGTYRAVVTFPVKYRCDSRPGATAAQARDLSAGGLRLICDEPLPSNAALTLEFTLPHEVLSIFSGATPQDPSPFGDRGILRQKPKDPRRPFEPMTIRATVAARLKDSLGHIVLGVRFIDADTFTREEITRYIHAVQLYRIRKNVSNA